DPVEHHLHCRQVVGDGVEVHPLEIVARWVLDLHRGVRAEKKRLVLQFVRVVHPTDGLADTAAAVRGHDSHTRKVFQDAAHDQPCERQAKIERASDAGGEAIFFHPLLPEAEMRRMNHHRHVEVLHQFPKRACFVVVWIMALVAGMNEDALESKLADRAFGLLDEGRAPAGQDGGEGVERALVFLLNLGGIIAPLLHRRQFFMCGLAAQIMRGVGHHADIDAVLVMSIEEVLEHHRAAAFAPFRPALAIGGAAIVGRLLRRIDVRMPIDDHAGFSAIEITTRASVLRRQPRESDFRCLFRLRTNVSIKPEPVKGWRRRRALGVAHGHWRDGIFIARFLARCAGSRSPARTGGQKCPRPSASRLLHRLRPCPWLAQRARRNSPRRNRRTFFVTSNGPGKGADLGGLEGADRHCQTLAQGAGAGGKTWRAYLSSQATDGAQAVNARDRIGHGPWQNFKSEVVAQNVDDLPGDTNKLGMQTSLTERGTMVAGVGYTPNYHDVLTGSQTDGRAFPAGEDRTCRNWTSSTQGAAMVGHIDRRGLRDDAASKSW